MGRNLAGFAVLAAVQFGRGASDGDVLAQQRFVDDEPYRAARRGALVVDKFASKRRFGGWAAWAQDRIRVRALLPPCTLFLVPCVNVILGAISDIDV